MITKIPTYHPVFYEYQALSSLSFKNKIKINVRIPSTTQQFENWNELDGMFRKGNRTIGIEVKSTALDDSSVSAIEKRLASFEFIGEAIIVAPGFDTKESHDARLIAFEPDIGAIREFYATFNPSLPERFVQNLGWHHFRFQSPFRAHSFRNQVDKRIKSIKDLQKEITTRLSWPPLRVFWTPWSLLNPKELYYKNAKPYFLYGPLFFDIDCTMLHYPCKLEGGLCLEGLRLARKAAKQLISLLREEGYSEIHVLFSGRRGYHVYVFDAKPQSGSGWLAERQQLAKKILRERIAVDTPTFLDRKSCATFPCSLHGISLREAVFDNSLLK